MYQQTVELAIDTETDERIAASDLLAFAEADFTAMRRQAMAERVERKKGGTKARYVCAICRVPLWLSRYNHEEGNRWFKHDEASLGCPWFEGNKLSPDQHRALIYRGQQEGAEHRRLKDFIATWLEKEPGVKDVNRELVTHGQILKGEWKRPDVQCVKDGQRSGRHSLYQSSIDIRKPSQESGQLDKNRLVIVVDDQPSLCSAVGNVLASAGYAVKTFASAEELLRSGVGDAACVVLDVALPGMNGFEAHQHLQSSSECPPVIFYSGLADPDGRVRTVALEAGALAFLQKPFDSDELLEAVTRACRGADERGAP